MIVACPVRPLAEGIDERKVGRRRFIFVATASQQRRAALLRMRDQLLREAGLPDPRFTRQQHEVAACLLRLVPVLLQLAGLRRAPDEAAAHEVLQERGGTRTVIFGAKRRELGRQIGGHQLEDRLGVAQSAQFLHAQVAQCRTGRKARPNLRCGRCGKQYLSAMPGRHYPLRAHQRQRRCIFTVSHVGCTGMHADSHA